MKVIGLMSGTSSDGVDAALVNIQERSGKLEIALLAFDIYSYPKSLQKSLIELASGKALPVATLCQMNFHIGERFADAVIQLVEQAGCPLSEIDLIGSHGQTVQHLPVPRKTGKWSISSTLQIGEPSIIAERTGVTTIADFRAGDMAAGGEGAPLTPYLHHHLFCSRNISRAIINIGGISNVTCLFAGQNMEEILAFDTGPGNMLIDGLISRMTKSRKRMDRGGAMARQGKINVSLLRMLMRHPFLNRHPPKSTGREEFGDEMLEKIFKKAAVLGLPQEDVIATVTLFTAKSIFTALEQFVPGTKKLDEVYICGGGGYNPVLLAHLKTLFDPIPVFPLKTLGYDERAIEAMTFALLAYQTWHGRPTNIPSVTGARHPVVLGKITHVYQSRFPPSRE